jgi:hypothetical protein
LHLERSLGGTVLRSLPESCGSGSKEEEGVDGGAISCHREQGG